MAEWTPEQGTPKSPGGRVLVLFLLFAISLYLMKSYSVAGVAAMALIPVMVIIVVAAFKHPYGTFFTLVIVNYFLTALSRAGFMPLPTSLPDEALELLLIAIAAITRRARTSMVFATPMFVLIGVWCTYCFLQVLNDTCGLGIDVASWFQSYRIVAFQLVYIYTVFALYCDKPQMIMKFLRIWAVLSIIAGLWVAKQIYIGFSAGEQQFLNGGGAKTHFVNGIIRYFSCFNDSATFGCHIGSVVVLFAVLGLTTRLKRDKLLFFVASALSCYGMFQSGTRTALVCMLAGVCVYMVLSKNLKIMAFVATAGMLFLGFLMFTNIGQGNPSIRRMRSTFNKEDASMGVREYNQAQMAKYLADAPFGIGMGDRKGKVPPSHKYHLLSGIAPDSEYVYIWIHTGRVGLVIYTAYNVLMAFFACWIVFFRLKDPRVRGIGAGLTCAFISLQVGGYANNIVMQYPNGLMFFGGLTLVYMLPLYEKEFIKDYEIAMAEQAERDRIAAEKEKARRVKRFLPKWRI